MRLAFSSLAIPVNLGPLHREGAEGWRGGGEERKGAGSGRKDGEGRGARRVGWGAKGGVAKGGCGGREGGGRGGDARNFALCSSLPPQMSFFLSAAVQGHGSPKGSFGLP